MRLMLEKIKQFATEDKIAFKKHCLLRMHQREISADEVQQILKTGTIIEEYVEDRPLPSCLVLGDIQSRKIHAVAAIDLIEEMLWVITVYEPIEDEWEPDYRRRRIK